MGNVAYIVGTGTVYKDGAVTGSLKGEVKSGAIKLNSVTINSNTDLVTVTVFNDGGSTGAGSAGKFVVATGSSQTIDYGGAMFTQGIRIAASGAMHGIIVSYG